MERDVIHTHGPTHRYSHGASDSAVVYYHHLFQSELVASGSVKCDEIKRRGCCMQSALITNALGEQTAGFKDFIPLMCRGDNAVDLTPCGTQRLLSFNAFRPLQLCCCQA